MPKWIVPLAWWMFAGLVLLAIIVPPALAAPVAEVNQGGVRVVLTDEKCDQSAVVNLQNRATWTENGKTVEGCFGVGVGSVIVLYFADKTIAVIPMRLFVRVSES